MVVCVIRETSRVQSSASRVQLLRPEPRNSGMSFFTKLIIFYFKINHISINLGLIHLRMLKPQNWQIFQRTNKSLKGVFHTNTIYIKMLQFKTLNENKIQQSSIFLFQFYLLHPDCNYKTGFGYLSQFFKLSTRRQKQQQQQQTRIHHKTKKKEMQKT